MRQLKITKQVTNRETASLDKYLQEIGKVDLITAEEEVELAQKIKAGDQIALEKLTKANLRFVVSVAKQYQNQGLTLPDLINEGNLGLIKAAVGGMVVPALVYVYINLGDAETLNGWAIPSATDIAFSLGVLSLLGKRVPLSLKVFLTALAIIDDLGAILIIAIFYSGDLSIKYLSLMLLAFIGLLVINKFNIKKFLPYLILGIFLWDFTHNSGIHATIAGVLLAMTIPHRKKEKDFSLLIKVEHLISPYVAFGIMPLFAFANAGVSLEGLSFSSLLDKVPLGIVLGLFVGKQLGVFVFSYLSIKLKIAQMPSNSNWYNFYGVGVLTGIGFTMSLFVGNLAFVDNMQYMDGVKIGVLTGSLLSTLFGYFLILLTPNK